MNKPANSKHRYLFSICQFLPLFALVNYGFCGQYYDIKVQITEIECYSVEERLHIVESAKTVEEAKGLWETLLSRIKKQDLSNIKVTLSSYNLPQKIIKNTDKEGVVVFQNIPHGVNEILAEKEVTVKGIRVQAVSRARLKSGKKIVYLQLRSDWLTLKGRVLNHDGTPVKGALISLKPFFTGQDSGEQYDNYPVQAAVSSIDGSYELPYVKPLSVDLAAKYLVYSNGVERSENFFYGEIYASKAPTKVYTYTPPRLRIPLISEDVANQARRCIPLVIKKMKQDDQNKECVKLPDSKGCVIFLPDIMINDDKSEVLPAAKDPKTTK